MKLELTGVKVNIAFQAGIELGSLNLDLDLGEVADLKKIDGVNHISRELCFGLEDAIKDQIAAQVSQFATDATPQNGEPLKVDETEIEEDEYI